MLEAKKEQRFQSTLPVGGATAVSPGQKEEQEISIHAPRGGSDSFFPYFLHSKLISIHAPRGGSDDVTTGTIRPRQISIHAPRGGSDLSRNGVKTVREVFQSTLPVGGATSTSAYNACICSISIHAPRGGSDCFAFLIGGSLLYFNPRSPWGERPSIPVVFICSAVFQSTLPVGGATGSDWRVSVPMEISIHAPRGGSDSKDAQIFL